MHDLVSGTSNDGSLFFSFSTRCSFLFSPWEVGWANHPQKILAEVPHAQDRKTTKRNQKNVSPSETREISESEVQRGNTTALPILKDERGAGSGEEQPTFWTSNRDLFARPKGWGKQGACWDQSCERSASWPAKRVTRSSKNAFITCS